MEQEHQHRPDDLAERMEDRLHDGQERVKAEIEEQAVHDPPDEQTSRESLELELMAQDDSVEGEDIGEHIE